MTPEHLIGLVLCGGGSRRMGRDKGLLLKDTGGEHPHEIPWAVYMGNKLKDWQIPLYYSINATQVASYSTFLSPDEWIIDSLDLPGPLNGLLSAHKKYPSKDLLLLACDMPDLDKDTLQKLIDVYNAQVSGQIPSGPQFFVYEDSSFAQPFCAIYTAAGLAPLYAQAQQGLLSDFRLQSIFRNRRTLRIAIDRPEAFKNYNTL